MGAKETSVVHQIMMDISPTGARLWKNIRGMFLSPNGAHRISAGLLVPGSGDLIGFKPMVVTADMIGRTVAIFCCVEAKSETGRASPEQLAFIKFVKDNGGFAGIARSPEDARKILQIDG